MIGTTLIQIGAIAANPQDIIFECQFKIIIPHASNF
jgi:hypothetical protein